MICLVGNIIKQLKHFSLGTKVYCLPSIWGDGYERIVVIGRHTGSKRLITIIISSKKCR